MPIGRNMRTKRGAEDGARRASMLNTPKNARRNMTHLSKSGSREFLWCKREGRVSAPCA